MSSAVGASYICASPPEKDTVTELLLAETHSALATVRVELKQVELEVGPVQPGLNNPGVQSVQMDAPGLAVPLVAGTQALLLLALRPLAELP